MKRRGDGLIDEANASVLCTRVSVEGSVPTSPASTVLIPRYTAKRIPLACLLWEKVWSIVLFTPPDSIQTQVNPGRFHALRLRPLVCGRSEFVGKNVLLVDDSIVRGTTSMELVQMAREAGARKVRCGDE